MNGETVNAQEPERGETAVDQTDQIEPTGETQRPNTNLAGAGTPPPRTQGRRRVKSFAPINEQADPESPEDPVATPGTNGTNGTNGTYGTQTGASGRTDPPPVPPPVLDDSGGGTVPGGTVPSGTVPEPSANTTVVTPEVENEPSGEPAGGPAGEPDGSYGLRYLEKYPEPFESPSTGDPEEGASEAAGEDTGEAGEGDLSGYQPAHRRVALVVLAAVILFGALFGARYALSGDEGAPAQNPQGGGEQAQNDAADPAAASEAAEEEALRLTEDGAELRPAALDVVETNIVFEALPKKQNGDVTLKAENTETGDVYRWTGVIKKQQDGDSKTDDGEQEVRVFKDLSMSGETSTNFRGGFELPEGELVNGSFAAGIPGERVLHAAYEQFREPSQNGIQAADGSYKMIDEPSGELLFSATYSDERSPGSDEVVRTYVERDPQQISTDGPGGPTGNGWQIERYSFEAPERTPIPMLVGKQDLLTSDQGSDDGDEDGSSNGNNNANDSANNNGNEEE